jgi:hypothetical protein
MKNLQMALLVYAWGLPSLQAFVQIIGFRQNQLNMPFNNTCRRILHSIEIILDIAKHISQKDPRPNTIKV